MVNVEAEAPTKRRPTKEMSLKILIIGLGNPILGEPPGRPGFYLCCGFMGHGFMMGPVVGKHYGEWLAGGPEPPFVEKWRQHLEWADPRYYFGFGYGADMNGLGAQGDPRGADAPDPVTYPFTGYGGVTVHRQVAGERTWDLNVDGVAQYGLYPDWIEDLRLQGGDEIVRDVARGSEAYLQMWERAVGIAPDSCRDDVRDPEIALGGRRRFRQRPHGADIRGRGALQQHEEGSESQSRIRAKPARFSGLVSSQCPGWQSGPILFADSATAAGLRRAGL